MVESEAVGVQRYLSDEYNAAMRSIYDELYLLNVTQNEYRIIYHVEHKYVTPPDEGVLLDGIKLVAEEMICPDDKKRFLSFFDLNAIRANFATGKDSMIGEFRKLWEDGLFHWASLVLIPVANKKDDEEGYLCFIMDIDDKKKAEEVAQQNKTLYKQWLDDERYRIIIEQTGTIVFEWVKGQKMRFVSPQMANVFAGNYKGCNIFKVWQEEGIVHPEDMPLFEEFLSSRKSEGHPETILRLRKKDGDYIWCKITLSSVTDSEGELHRVIGTINDVDEAMRAKYALQYKAEFDTLTSIYNEGAFHIYAAKLLKEHPEKPYAVVRIDINRFKLINDIYGREEGDKLLQFIANCIKHAMKPNDVCGRINSDIFAFCVGYQSIKELTSLMQRIVDNVKQYSLGYTVTPSFGICFVDDRNMPISILCDWAKLALDTIKGNMLIKWAFYDDNLRARQLDERMIEDQMEIALREGQFDVYMQPKHEIASGNIIGAEALVRWNHPKEGLLPPVRFISLFEKNGFIVKLDEYVWEKTIQAIRCWIDRGDTPVPVSVNVSRIHIYNIGFENKLAELLKTYRVPAKLIGLELTESTFVENPEELYQIMKVLQEKGFSFLMDDFGSGYSSLNMLKNAPINTIKLDRAFLNETTGTQRGQIIIRNMITMAKQLELLVVAEGVETQKQALFLRAAGCDVAQGYYYSRPMPMEEFEKCLYKGNANGAIDMTLSEDAIKKGD